MAHAGKINLGGILKSLVPDIPDFLFGFCKALSFAQVNVGYVNGAFTLLAVPDVLSSPELKAILKVRCSSARPAAVLAGLCEDPPCTAVLCACCWWLYAAATHLKGWLPPLQVTGFTQDDIHLSTGSGGTGTSLSVVKGLTLNLPGPFVGPAELHFSLAVSDKVPGSIMFSGSFAAGLDVFGQGELGVCLLPNRTNLNSIRECAASHTLPDNPGPGSSHLNARAAWSAGTQHSVVLCQPSVGSFACLVIASPALPACRRAAL